MVSLRVWGHHVEVRVATSVALGHRQAAAVTGDAGADGEVGVKALGQLEPQRVQALAGLDGIDLGDALHDAGEHERDS